MIFPTSYSEKYLYVEIKVFCTCAMCCIIQVSKKEDTAIVATHDSVCGEDFILFGLESFELVAWNITKDLWI